MGYTTDFSGQFKTSRPLTETEMNYMNKFSNTRRMKRDSVKLMEKFKGEFGHPTRPDNPYGNDGEFFVGGTGWAGQDHDDSIIEYNTAPGQPTYNQRMWEKTREKIKEQIKIGNIQPGLWCQWVFTDDETLEWDGSGKFYNYVEWLKYLINNFFEEWGIKLNGEVSWVGEDSSDKGKILVEDNKVRVFEVEEIYKEVVE